MGGGGWLIREEVGCLINFMLLKGGLNRGFTVLQVVINDINRTKWPRHFS